MPDLAAGAVLSDLGVMKMDFALLVCNYFNELTILSTKLACEDYVGCEHCVLAIREAVHAVAYFLFRNMVENSLLPDRAGQRIFKTIEFRFSVLYYF